MLTQSQHENTGYMTTSKKKTRINYVNIIEIETVSVYTYTIHWDSTNHVHRLILIGMT